MIDPQNLAKYIAAQRARTNSSRTWAERSRPFLAEPLGPIRFLQEFKQLAYPIVVARSEGSHFQDIDGNDYLDFSMGFGSSLFGHNPQFLKEALAAQIDAGFFPGGLWSSAEDVVDLIRKFSGMERVAFACSGAEAMMIALRIARAATMRPRIVIFTDSYHGHYDATQAAADPSGESYFGVPLSPGIPRGALGDVLVLPYGADVSLQVIADQAEELAAVVVEPLQTRHPELQPKEFLQKLRALTKEADVPLIFDDVVTGFRVAQGGAQEWAGVRADMAIYGKALAGGMPMAVIAGSARFLDGIDGGAWNFGDTSEPHALEIFTSSTFAKHPLSLAAARAVLGRIDEAGPSLQENLNAQTHRIVVSLNDSLQKEGFPIRFASWGSFFGPSWVGDENWSIAIPPLHYALASEGIYLYGASGFLSSAHMTEELDHLCATFQKVVSQLKPPHS